VRLPFHWPADDTRTVTAKGDTELGTVTLQVAP